MEYTPLHHSYDANREDEYASYPGITTPIEDVDFSDVKHLFAGKSDDEVAAIKQSVYEERQFMHEQWLSRNANNLYGPGPDFNVFYRFLKENGDVDVSDVEYLFAGKSDDEVAAIKQSVYEERQFMHEQWLSRNADKFNIPSGKNILDEFLKEHGINL